ncbi:MAG TPA: agmatine deiminase family protein [Chitinophagales bacterium]|nr:agmatine deiminase family protein [Chitinophagales bacterium]
MRAFLVFSLLLASAAAFAQTLPIGMTPAEKQTMPSYLLQRDVLRGTLPPTAPVRTPAQWEEMQGVVISWKSTDYALLTKIIDHAQEVVQVFIFCSDSNDVKDELSSDGVPLYNLSFIQFSTNSIWARDYAANSVYENEVHNLSLTDWEYNRPRPKDDTSARKLSALLNVPLYETIQSPNRLVNTGGNFMTDGHGTAFASKLVTDENAFGGGYGNNLTEEDVDSVMKRYMGIDRYIKMETLPYDDIHHIDMHMKLLDEETLLVGEYPAGVSDGPKIEQNLSYVLDNHLSCFGRPYKVIRIPQPPSPSGNYPGIPFGSGYYRTYTNAVILNSLVLVPYYYEQYDTVAQRIWKEAMPGYDVVFLDGNAIIQNGGSIHCITHEIGVSDPIFISHAKLLDTYQTSGTYEVNAYINTQSGVNAATMHWSLDTALGYTAVPMTDMGSGDFQAFLPAQPVGTEVFYYVEAISNSGRTVRKPFVAPKGVYAFDVLGTPTEVIPTEALQLFEPYPVPANEAVNVSFRLVSTRDVSLELTDVTGRLLQVLPLEKASSGVHHYAFNTTGLPVGTYFIRLADVNGEAAVQKFSVVR